MLYSIRKISKIEEINLIKDIPELQDYIKTIKSDILLDDYIIELVSIGALCHDLGHGPFSHLFDDNFLKHKTTISKENKFHEYRSCNLLKKIIKENDFLNLIISDIHIRFINNIINPNKKIHKEYIYQIVSNSLNSIDVDKFDYLTRDSKMLNINISFNFNRLVENAMIINNIICYPKKVDSDIINMFQNRHYMHKKVYSHKGVISSLFVIIELLENLEKIINFTESVNDLNEFIKYTDDYILNISRYLVYNNTDNEYINNIKKILNIIDNHSFYTLIYHNYIDIKSTDDKFKNDLYKNISIDSSDIIKYESIIGFISGKKNNPLKSIYLYKSKDPYKSLEILGKSDSIRLIPNKYQEKLIMIFYKHKDVEIIKLLKNLYNNN
jgi:HD superfamily phosphohydrolase